MAIFIVCVKNWRIWKFIYRNESFSFVWDDSLENLEQLWFGDLSVVILVNSSDELVNFLLGDLSSLTHMLEGVVNQLSDFVGLQSSAFVLIVGIEDGINGVSKVIIWITHVSRNKIFLKWLWNSIKSLHLYSKLNYYFT